MASGDRSLSVYDQLVNFHELGDTAFGGKFSRCEGEETPTAWRDKPQIDE